MYKINQKVRVSYGRKGKRAPKRWYVRIGKIENVGKYDMYKVGYRALVNTRKVFSSFSVEGIADLQVQRRSDKQNAAGIRVREMVKQPED